MRSPPCRSRHGQSRSGLDVMGVRARWMSSLRRNTSRHCRFIDPCEAFVSLETRLSLFIIACPHRGTKGLKRLKGFFSFLVSGFTRYCFSDDRSMHALGGAWSICPVGCYCKASAEDEQRLAELTEKEIVGRNLLGVFGPLLVSGRPYPLLILQAFCTVRCRQHRPLRGR